MSDELVFAPDDIPVTEIPGFDAIEVCRGDVSLWQAFMDYTHEWAKPQGINLSDLKYVVRNAVTILGPQLDIAKIDRSHSRLYTKVRLEQGVQPATIRKELTFVRAAVYHAEREDRIKVHPKFQMPASASPRVRWLTREEHRRLMLTPMPERLKRFYLLAFATGARAQAIEELTWDRVDFERRTIDYRVPGVIYKNKRRVVSPISDALLPRLQSMFERRDPRTELVIGVGPSGKATNLYNAASKAMKAAGIEGAVPRHVCRHTFASWLLQGDPARGIPPTPVIEVARLLGDTVKMIDDIYGHLSQEQLFIAANRLH